MNSHIELFDWIYWHFSKSLCYLNFKGAKTMLKVARNVNLNTTILSLLFDCLKLFNLDFFTVGLSYGHFVFYQKFAKSPFFHF